MKKENIKGSSRNVLMTFSQSYIKHDLRKNKIVMLPPPLFLGINIKFRMIKSIFCDTILKGLIFNPYVLVLNPKTSFKALEHNY
jgi:hypothetical protein